LKDRVYLYLIVGAVVLYFLYANSQAATLAAQQRAATLAASTGSNGLINSLIGIGSNAANQAVDSAFAPSVNSEDDY
jgi:hypothetical protein